MILAQDLIDLHGRILVTAGTALRREILALLNKHQITSVWIKDDPIQIKQPVNREITTVNNLISTATRRKMIQTMQNAFRHRGSVAAICLICVRQLMK